MAFSRVSSSDSLEVRQALTRNNLALAEQAYSMIVMFQAAKIQPDAQMIADLTQSYVNQQNRHLDNNHWGLTREEVLAGLDADGLKSIAALSDLQTVSAGDANAAIATLASVLPSLGVASETITAKLGPTLQRAQAASASLESSELNAANG